MLFHVCQQTHNYGRYLYDISNNYLPAVLLIMYIHVHVAQRYKLSRYPNLLGLWHKHTMHLTPFLDKFTQPTIHMNCLLLFRVNMSQALRVLLRLENRNATGCYYCLINISSSRYYRPMAFLYCLTNDPTKLCS